MKHDIEETVIAAMMENEPVIIVEGQDDIKFYSNIARKSGCYVNVQAVETIEGYVEGCDGVISAIEDVQALISADVRVKRYVLGIVDRDARYYMNTIPELDNLLVLKYYSYESHLVTSKSIRKLLSIMVKANAELVTDEVVNYIKQDFETTLLELYYFSLEALKARCDVRYEACVTFGDKAGKILGHGADEYYWSRISAKKEELDEFAAQMEISFENVRQVANGKWYLFCWCEYIIQKCKHLYESCGSELPKCIYCEVGKPEKCLWRQESVFQIPNIKSILYSEEVVDLEEISYITNRMHDLVSV